MKNIFFRHSDTRNPVYTREVFNSQLPWILLACMLVFIIFIRIRLLPTPLERDEGEYAYMGQLLLQGIPPYTSAFNMKLPGTSMMYALFMFLFGETISAIHLGLLIVNVISIIILFLLTKKMLSSYAGVIAAMTLALTTISPALFGFAAHATHFVVVFASGALLTLTASFGKKKNIRFFISGILFGFSFLMKQPGILFFFFGISILLIYRTKYSISKKEFYRFILMLSFGFMAPVILVFLVVLYNGTFNQFWFWIVQYSALYGTMVTFDSAVTNLTLSLKSIWKDLPLFSILVCAGLFLILTNKLKNEWKRIILLGGMFSLLSLLPGWYFRNHYFILVAPFCSICAAAAYCYLEDKSKQHRVLRFSSLIIFSIVVIQNIFTHKDYYFTVSPKSIVDYYCGENFFSESIQIGNFLNAHTEPQDYIAVIGSEPQIYFYAKRRSASAHIYMYGMMEPQPYAHVMQQEFIADVERLQPKFIVYLRLPYSWLVKPTSDLQIFQWSKDYVEKCYRKVCVVDLIGLNNVKYVWGDNAQWYSTLSPNAIFIAERVDSNKRLQ